MTSFDFSVAQNQVPALHNFNLYESDVALKTAVDHNGGGWNADSARRFGELLGRADTLELGNLANRHLPSLRTHDGFGNRLDSVDFHPAYHELMRISIQNGTHSLAWTSTEHGKYVARSALAFMKQQVDEGTSCPLTMTFAAVPSLTISAEIEREWLPLALSTEYDPRFLPANEKRGLTFGMAMTEPQGGSDVRANITVATRLTTQGEYQITGRKWFCSAPMSDAFLVLAQTEKGLSCFLMPRFLPSGKKNTLYFQRLKDKLGNQSNASGEVEFHAAYAKIIGEEGRGVANIMEMVRHTRLDCAVGSAGTLRRAVAEGVHHCAHRHAFGKLLIDQPLMTNLLADLALESEAATALAFRLARGFDESLSNEQARYFTRTATAIGKYWNCKRAVTAMGELVEIIGGNGYVEESVLPRLYRDIPVNSIWEGSGNVQCLDVLRAIQKDPKSIDAIFVELDSAAGRHDFYDTFIQQVKNGFSNSENLEYRSRQIVEDFAVALQAAALLNTAPDYIANAFCTSRLANSRFVSFGTLPTGMDVAQIIRRASPHQ